MKRAYAKVMQRRFIYTYLVTVITILTLANYNYAIVVENEIQEYVSDSYKQKSHLDIQKYKEISSMQTLTMFTIIEKSIVNKAIPVSIKVNDKFYLSNYKPYNNYYIFLFKPFIVLSVILLFFYFSINKLISLGLKRLKFLEVFLETYVLEDVIDESLHTKLNMYDDEICEMGNKLYALLAHDKQLANKQKRFLQKLEELHEIILSFDQEYKIIEFNKPWNEIKNESILFLDYIEQKNIEALERNMFSLKHGLLETLILTDSLLSLANVYELKIIYADGVFSVIIRDITEMYSMHEKLKYMSLHDSLTGLANRELFVDRLRLLIQKAKRNKDTIAILFFDLDDFKVVNDKYGHHIGDQVLKEFVLRVSTALRESDTLARFGGDEFLAILPNMKDENIEPIIDKILLSLQDPLEIDEITIELSSSIGVSFCPSDSTDVDELLLQADKAMYACKKSKKSFCIYKEIAHT